MAPTISDADWESATLLLPTFGPRLESLMRSLLDDGEVRPHSVSHRPKDRVHAERKLASKSGDYSLAQMTDLLGLRVITYFEDEVDRVATLVEREFEIDLENSVDKRALLDPDRFGYLSLHYVARLSPARRAFSEYRRFGEIKFEIQIRSILQHAWAEIEHDLGYKTEGAIPRDIRRRFSRLAGVLELADEEFSQIRSSLMVHEAEVEASVRENRLDVGIDRDSVRAYVRESTRVRNIDDAIATSIGRGLDEIEDHTASVLAANLQRGEFSSIEQIDSRIAGNEALIERFGSKYYLSRRPAGPDVPPPSVHYGLTLAFVLVLEIIQFEREKAERALKQIGFPLPVDEALNLRDEAEG